MVNIIDLVALAMLGVALAEPAETQVENHVEVSGQDVTDNHTCVHPPYNVHLFSQSPLIVYIENFITPDERAHLLAETQGKFTSSSVVNSRGQVVDSKVRTSKSAELNRDAIVSCIEERAREFQGFDLPVANIETFQLVKYAETKQYLHHTDWFKDEVALTSLGGNRVSSFFGVVRAHNVTGGGTNFPTLEAPRDESWCRFIDCDQPYKSGVTFRPIEGNLVYWRNLLESGEGDWRTLHAGLPVVTGEKVGINIWTRQAPVPLPWRQ